MRQVFLAVGMALWAAAVYGATRLHEFDLPLGHGICGPWGCAAQPEALLGYHALLASLIVPVVALSCLAAPPRVGVRLSQAVAGIGFFGLLGLAGWAAISWARGPGDPAYALQRAGFVVATTPDLPVVQLLVAGIAGRLVCFLPRRPVEPGGGSRENQAV